MTKSTSKAKGIIGLGLLCLMAGLGIQPGYAADAGTVTESLTLGPKQECIGKNRASIAISRFDNRARNWDFYSAGIGDGMADQLTTALVATGCFRVVDRQNLVGVMDELGLQNSGAVDEATASKIGKLVGADLIVTAAVTEFEENTSGSRSGGVAAGRSRILGVVGGLMSARESAHMAVDLRITDVQTSEIIGATAVKGTATDTNSGALLGALVPGAGGLGALENWENTPRGAALRDVITQAVDQIYNMIPPGYFYHTVGRFATPGTPPAPAANNVAPAAAASGADEGGGVTATAQQTLKELGLYTGSVDGNIGPSTEAAIRSFQEQMGLEVNGRLDLPTLRELRSFRN